MLTRRREDAKTTEANVICFELRVGKTKLFFLFFFEREFYWMKSWSTKKASKQMKESLRKLCKEEFELSVRRFLSLSLACFALNFKCKNWLLLSTAWRLRSLCSEALHCKVSIRFVWCCFVRYIALYFGARQQHNTTQQSKVKHN